MFIEGLNAISGFLELLDAVIDRVGGLHGVLSTLGVVLTKVFSQ
jgi:hypothetical protein